MKTILFSVTLLLLINNSSFSQTEPVLGFDFLNKIPGQWNGPVTSTTSAGSFDQWYVDFRPVSASQVSQFSLLDSNTVNIFSFFVVKHDGKLKLAMRTEGCFKNQCCVTYEVMDSVATSGNYFRFCDFVKGVKRAYTEFVFNGDEMTMKVYTNKFNKVFPLEPHTTWTATLASRDNAKDAIAHFNYPQPKMIKDFSDEFKNMEESIFFNLDNDPYKTADQPYLGSITVNISIDKKLNVVPTDEICILLTTKPFFEGIQYLPERKKFISKAVFLTSETSVYTIKNAHPGKYYIYTYVDKNNDKKHLSGDYMNSNVTQSFVVPPDGNASVNSHIDFIIP
ncbi:MAG: hypothetical protein CVU05_02565 [Bacteroidetes bacterium HGW-Bacteroidetes-21]|nr:MAG: hypothetical protein CVU05_02565 [Bacteroidetes bacterium HGW-Bacteroidetes-21]